MSDRTPGDLPDSAGAPGGSRFDAACVDAVTLLLLQDQRVLDSAEEAELTSALRLIVTELPHLVLSRVAGHSHDAQDIASEGAARFVRAVQAGRVDPRSSPAGYLLTICVNLIRDRHRRPPLPMPADDFVLETHSGFVDDTDAVAGLLGGEVDAAVLRDGIRRAHLLGDLRAVEVVLAWLNFAARENAAPNIREVAVEMGVGKSTAAAALARFRAFIDEVD